MNNKPHQQVSQDPFIEKHLAIIKQKTKDALINEHIGKMWGDLSSASIKYFLETGTINGGFREHLINLMDAWKKYKLDEPASSSIEAIQLVKDLAEWSKRYPRGRIYSMSNMTMDTELIAMEERAKKFMDDYPDSAPTISKEDERVTRNRNTIYTYYQVEFNYCSAFDGDYMICESIEQITDLLKQVDINLDDPEVKATVEIKGIPMTPSEYETWLKENDTSF